MAARPCRRQRQFALRPRGLDLAARSLRLAARLLVRREDGRVWIPPYYQWTPNGYVYVDGYWDYPLQDRGVMFAPVYFSQPLWNNSNWSYQPSYVVSPSSFLDSAFTNGPGFYFGNYYGNAGAGFNPWYAGGGRYDPTFGYNGLKNPAWLAGARQNYASRTAGTLNAPPLSFAQLGNSNFITPLNQITGFSLISPSVGQRSAQRNGIQQTRQLAVTRQQFEAGRTQQPQTIRMTAGSGGLRITNGSSTAGGPSPRITNAPRTVTPSSSGIRITNGPSTQAPTFTPSAPRIVTPTPTRTAPAHAAPAHAPAGRRH